MRDYRLLVYRMSAHPDSHGLVPVVGWIIKERRGIPCLWENKFARGLYLSFESLPTRQSVQRKNVSVR